MKLRPAALMTFVALLTLGACQQAPRLTDPSHGGLELDISGLTENARANVLVTGPGGYSQVVEASGTLTGLVPGAYLVTPAESVSDAARFEPDGASTSITIEAATTVTHHLSYTCAAVIFGDADLEENIRGVLGKAQGEITCADMEGITSVVAPDIGDLAGIQHAINLATLAVYGDYSYADDRLIEGIADLSPLGRLTGLESLDVSYSFVTDLGPLENLGNLRRFVLRDHHVVDLDPLQGLTGLKHLSLVNGPTRDLAPLRGLTGLQTLAITQSLVSDLTPLEGLASLTSLTLQSNSIEDVEPLRGLTGLEHLWIGYNPLRNISALGELTNLIYLSLQDSRIGNADLAELQDLTNLSGLELDTNNISILTPLSGMTNLGYLRLGRNEITDVSPLASLTRLGSIFLDDNNVSDIGPLQSLTDLELASLSNNHITDLQALVDNVSIGAGDRVRVYCNDLDLSPGSSAATDIEALEARGVIVSKDPQRPDESCD